MNRPSQSRRRNASRAALVALALGLTACGSSGPKGDPLPGPPAFVGFPEVGFVDGVELTALVPKAGSAVAHPQTGKPLRFIAEQGLIPIEVALYLRDTAEAGEVAVREVDMEFRMVLSDGTVLGIANPGVVEAAIKGDNELAAFRDLRFQTGAIDAKDTGGGRGRGLVFFSLPPGPVSWTGTTRFAFERGGYLREVDLQHSLVSVNFMRDGKLRNIATGVQLGQ